MPVNVSVTRPEGTWVEIWLPATRVTGTFPVEVKVSVACTWVGAGAVHRRTTSDTVTDSPGAGVTGSLGLGDVAAGDSADVEAPRPAEEAVGPTAGGGGEELLADPPRTRETRAQASSAKTTAMMPSDPMMDIPRMPTGPPWLGGR